MDQFQSLKAFVLVVECRSFTEAARRLNISGAAVSRQVAFLEKSLGGRLLNRTTRKLGLTEIGQVCFERCARIVSEMDEMQRITQAGTVSPHGTLRVSSVMMFWISQIAPVLPEFLCRYPGLSVQVTLTERLIDLVEEGYDLALQFVEPRTKSTVRRKLAPIHRAVFASADYLRKHGSPSHPDQLRKHNCLLYAHYAEQVEWRFIQAGNIVDVKVDGNLRSTDAITVRHAAVQGLGIARGPMFLVHEDLESGELVRVLPQYEVTSLDLLAVYPSRLQLPAKVRVFIDFLKEKFAHERTLNRLS